MTASSSSAFRSASWAAPGRDPSQWEESDGSPTWALRADRFVVLLTLVRRGTQLHRGAGRNESMLLLPPGVTAQVQQGDVRLAAGGDSLTILPPGASTITMESAGSVVRVFTAHETDLVAQASNAGLYAGAPVPDPLPWHAPLDVHRLRHYPLASYARGEGPLIRPRIFRSDHLMLNAFEPFSELRPLSEVRPHAHADYDQASITLEGNWFHHLRTPWGADMTQWRDDQHVQLSSPSIAILPAGVIHTSRNTTPGAWLLDVFGTPRADFLHAGIVLNAHEYAMPPDSASLHPQLVPPAWRRAV